VDPWIAMFLIVVAICTAAVAIVYIFSRYDRRD
jgi:hypothetical protein